MNRLSNQTSELVYKVRDDFCSSLFAWWALNKRSFPWRRDGVTPYEVLLAEVLLKRTTAAAVDKVFIKLYTEYDDVYRLAQATDGELEEHFKYIGLQKQRAKGIKQMASYICEHEDSKIPNDYGRLIAIPHVGSYTARAVLSFGFGIPVSIVDSNVVRIIRRIFANMLQDTPNLRIIQDYVDLLCPNRFHREFNWAVLDFGALLCRPNRPLCDECGLRHLCGCVLQSK